MSKDPIIVLGSPRSGTTLLSKILSQMGVFMGYNINDAFEDWFWIRINEHIMDRMDIYWDRPKRPHDRCNIDYNLIINHIRQSNAWNLNIQWGFKDPRTTIVADVWQDIFNRMDVEPTWIRIERHPMDICASLVKREHEKPDEYLHVDEPESRDLETGEINTYPVKSRRAMKKEGALELAYEYQDMFPDLADLTLQFESVVNEPRSTMEKIARTIDRPSVDVVEDLVNPSRAHAYRENESLMRFWENNRRDR